MILWFIQWLLSIPHMKVTVNRTGSTNIFFYFSAPHSRIFFGKQGSSGGKAETTGTTSGNDLLDICNSLTPEDSNSHFEIV